MGIKFQKIDILDLEGLEDIIKNFKINEVYHLAAILSASGEKNPSLCWDINVNGLLNVLELSRKYKYRIFLYFMKNLVACNIKPRYPAWILPVTTAKMLPWLSSLLK